MSGDPVEAMIERLILQGAEVRLGVRKFQVVHEGDGTRTVLSGLIGGWSSYLASGRSLPPPRRMRKGLRRFR
ncbi:MAG: hypothetical protein AB7F67_03860 [Rhodospirillaceae bacterium]